MEGMGRRSNEQMMICMCPDCYNAFNSKGGLNAHRRVSHPDVYHAARQPAARMKARWSHEELVLLARAELEIRRTNPVQGVLRVLHSRFPDRAFKAIKSLRNKNLRYKEVLSALEVEESVSEPTAEVPFEHFHSSTNVDGLWRDQLRMAINIRHLGVDDLDWVIDGCPDQDIRNKLDELFTSWVGHLVRGERSSSGNPRPASNAENPNRELDPGRRRRAQYSALQHLYGRKPSACAHKLLDGTWENTEPSTAPYLEQFWKTWLPIFKDIIGLGMDELCCHYNLWLLCGSQPSALCTGCTVFLPKGSEFSDALKYHRITIASHFLQLFHKVMARRFDASCP